ncbi:unnamed protein product [Adineta steineri]|uniref:G-protein coupled receptors family 1 profile domain-containing protein n=1 Tax=Adineta steineri TaxID=433720 RepID=A0A815CWB8_9BILA|nr:unnamed protein product [Adineta steineri]CAF3975526.1 unnamed protein product [Adineta steineri]
MIPDNNLNMTTIESWFIPIDILKIIFASIAIILSLIFLFIIIIDKTCHTVPMMLIANSCLVQSVFALNMFGTSLFTLQNDLKQIQFYNSFCIFQGYITYMIQGIQMNSYLLQSIYCYITIVYPFRLFWQSARFQICLICLTWICGIIYPIPLVFTNQITYHVDDQICQMPLNLSFITIFNASYNYFIPLSLIILVYFKIVQFVKKMNKRVTPANTMIRIEREFRMIRRIISLVFILVILGFPYALFILMSFFHAVPKYAFRIAYIFVNASLTLVMIALFEISEPLKMSIMKRIHKKPTRVIPTVA